MAASITGGSADSASNDAPMALLRERVRLALRRRDLKTARLAAGSAPRAVRAQAAYWTQLAQLALHEGIATQAMSWAKKALELARAEPAALLVLAEAALREGEAEDADRALRTVLCAQPDHPIAHALMGRVRLSTGDLERAMHHLEVANAGPDPDPRHLSHQLYLTNFMPHVSAEQLRAMHEAAGERLALAHGAIETRAPTASRHRVERIGFVSGDFRAHAVAFFLTGPLAALKTLGIETFAYSTSSVEDALTAQFRDTVAGWRCIAGMPTNAAVDLVRADGLDVLVDLSGHTEGAELGIFLQRAAPVQLTWLGYPNTTGLTCFDGRIVDDVTDPPCSAHLASEPLLRLSPCFLAYEPHVLPDLLAHGDRRARDGRSPCPTLGSFNNFSKVNERVVDLWARILRAAPDAQLMLKSSKPRGTADRQRIARDFERRGVKPSRLHFLPRAATIEEHMRRYDEIDVALDTFPYNGTTTTCEALAMGVPVVALLGDRHAARVSASILHAAGIADDVAESEDDYVARALQLIRERDERRSARVAARRRMLSSPLCDSASFTRAFVGLAQNALDQRRARVGAGRSLAECRSSAEPERLEPPLSVVERDDVSAPALEVAR